ncbi:hypothetical protein CRI94_12450 [Longibacter salinarum]|uniref:Secretion system C-terminal sorting domain-containing protein n=1 Tax=Longibacter salinarum TaxID=1850348 RepID=A0A2A8CW25_9BACT|nr:T9SS type A sorting domain-containing protein [Longibacter salinarum]PEN12811.1 hypothetical protein CRI94_12450 [Longibacter salinarum]
MPYPHRDDQNKQSSLWSTLSLFFLCVAAIFVAGAYSTFQTASSGSVQLPLEVIGDKGHTVSVNVDVSDASGVDNLHLEVHNLAYHWSEWAENGTDPHVTNGGERYDQKASFRINGGPWVGMTKERITCDSPESEFGCMDGPLSNKTMRIAVDATESGSWTSGQNTIEFRFNGTEGYSSGYRILDLDVRAGTQSRLGSTTFTWDDPASWSPPYSSSSDISKGKELWHARGILVESPLDGKPITASCADCHARDGRDLKYFNFSNKSIVARSTFHGLTDKEGRQIASYIRSVDLELPSGYDVSDAGRPWNPPYQPGPGLDERPVELWAAGAGIDCVVDRDEDSAPFLFPSDGSETVLRNADHDPDRGVDCNKLADQISMTSDQSKMFAMAHTDSTMNNREVPVQVQWPDIFEWWPDVHPVDIWDVSTVENQDWYKNYLSIHDDLETSREQMIATARDNVGERRGGNTTRLDRRISKLLDRWNNWDPPVDASFSTEFEKRYSTRQFLSMKLWEIMHEHKLEGLGAEIYGPEGQPDRLAWGPEAGSLPNGIFAGGQDRVWFNNANVYDTSPHKNQRKCCGAGGGTPQYGQGAGTHRNARSRNYWGDIWYDLALTLAPGNRLATGNNPYDWNYNSMHIQSTSEYNSNQGVRYFRHYISAIQQFNRFYQPDSDIKAERKGSWPWSIHGHSLQKLEVWEVQNMLTSMNSNLRNRFTEAAIDSWIKQNNEWAVSDWRRDDKGNSRIPDQTYKPQKVNSIKWSANRADMFYSMMHLWSGRNLDGRVLDRAARWGEKMWPNGDWEQWFVEQSSSDMSLNSGWNIVSSSIAPDDASMETVFGSIVSDVVLVKNEVGETYIPDYGINTIGSWSSDEAYKVYLTKDSKLSMNGSVLDPTAPIKLEQGWNLVAYWPDGSMSAEEAFSSISSELVIVKDYAGDAYIPSENLNTLDAGSGLVRPGQGYQIYVDNATTLTYPSSKAAYAKTSSAKARRGHAVTATAIVESPSMSDGTSLLAKTAKGRIVGKGIVSDGRGIVRLWGDDPQTTPVDGATSGERLSIYVGSETGESLDVQKVEDMLSDRPISKIAFQENAVLKLVAGDQNTELLLRGIAPNPVQGSATIEFVLPKQERVSLEVYDVLGRRVATLVDELRRAGEHKVRMDASRLDSGPYFYRLRAGSTTLTKKMTVVR